MPTQYATAAAALGWMFAEWIFKGKPSVLGIASGAVAGVVCFLAATSLKRALGYDDSLDAFGVHCIGGIVGALLTGVFASKEISGSEGSLLTQFWGVATTLVYGFTVSFIILKVIDMTIGLRVSEEEEREGLDISQHGEKVE
jgi:ammonium transporter, Amt family